MSCDHERNSRPDRRHHRAGTDRTARRGRTRSTHGHLEQRERRSVTSFSDDEVAYLRIYGTAEIVEREGQFGSSPYLRVTPTISWSFNLDGAPFTHDRPVSVRRTVHDEPHRARGDEG